MRGATIRAKRTGRAWGQRQPEVEKRLSILGVPVIAREFDAWDGPTTPNERGEYIHHTVIEAIERTDWWNMERAS